MSRRFLNSDHHLALGKTSLSESEMTDLASILTRISCHRAFSRNEITSDNLLRLLPFQRENDFRSAYHNMIQKLGKLNIDFNTYRYIKENAKLELLAADARLL